MMPAGPNPVSNLSFFAIDQRKDQSLSQVILFLEKQVLPADPDKKRARKVALQAPLITLEGRVLYYVDPKPPHSAS